MDQKAAPKRAPAPSDAPEDITCDMTLAFESNRLASSIFGQYDQNLAVLERELGISANANGNHVRLKGLEKACQQAQIVLERLYARAKQGLIPQPADVETALAETNPQGVLFSARDGEPAASLPAERLFAEISTRKRGLVRARNAAQDYYLRLLKNCELVFAEGPAGTGKTWLAVGYAVSLLERGLVDRLILSRPAVEAGERLGFLPGDMKDKVDPYLRPIYDALHDFMEGRIIERGLQTGMIEVAPLAFMRGRTLTKAAILLDEAQNATSVQMKMFLTRLGDGARMIITGDPTQVDLPNGQTSGLAEAVHLLDKVEGIGHVAFAEGDVVRHPLVRRIVGAYEQSDQQQKIRKALALKAG